MERAWVRRLIVIGVAVILLAAAALLIWGRAAGDSAMPAYHLRYGGTHLAGAR
jgi:hypothetical protein